jgi:hypothetical protein
LVWVQAVERLKEKDAETRTNDLTEKSPYKELCGDMACPWPISSSASGLNAFGIGSLPEGIVGISALSCTTSIHSAESWTAFAG